MNTLLLIAAASLLLSGILLLWLLNRKNKTFGALGAHRAYQDTLKQPGKILYAKTLNLCGKPDYIIKKDGVYIPVEEKPRAKTPYAPWPNHKIQLMAECFLVEEHYGIRPPGGVLRYKEREFWIAYTDEEKEAVRRITEEITGYKMQGGAHFSCRHPQHNNLRPHGTEVAVKRETR
jgi:CRISPR-associated exonuclease Cas4